MVREAPVRLLRGPAPKRGRGLFGASVLALAAAVHPGGVLAEGPLEREPTWDEPFPVLGEAPRRFGPIEVAPEIAVRNLGYDDNIFTSEENKTSDFTGEIVAGASALLRLSHRATLAAREALGAEVFAVNTEQSNFNNNAQARGDLLLGSVLLSGRGEWDKRNLTPGAEFDVRPEQRRTTAGIEAWWFLSSITDVSAGVSSRRYRYRDPDFFTFVKIDEAFEEPCNRVVEGQCIKVDLGELLDREETGTTLRFRWKGLPRTRLSLELRDTDYAFREQRLGRDAQDRRIRLGAEVLPGRAWDGWVHLGLVDFQPDEPGKSDFRGIYGDARLRLLLLDRVELPLRYERDLEFSSFDNILFYVRDDVSAEARVHLWRSGWVLAGRALGHARYPTRGTVLFPDEVRRDTITTSYAGFGVRMGPAWEIEVQVGVRRQQSNYDPADDSQFFVRNGLRRRF